MAFNGNLVLLFLLLELGLCGCGQDLVIALNNTHFLEHT